MRLIDADLLLENIVHLNNVYVQGRMAYIIDNQPTAYDVEAVVAELEKESYIETADDMNPYPPSKVVSLRKAISIVRGKE